MLFLLKIVITFPEKYNFKDPDILNIQRIAKGGLSFIDENKIIITEKNGSIKLFNIDENKIYLIKA